MIRAGTSTRIFTGITLKCREEQQKWATRSVRQRLHPVRALRHLLAKEYQTLCEAVARDFGKPIEESLAGELLPLAEACRFLERQAGRILQPKRVSRRHLPLWLWPQRDTVHRRPRGLVGIIGTWNYPLLLNGVQIVQALTAGNGVLWKPSELASSSAQAFFDLLGRAGFPPGLVYLLPATREAGESLTDADIDHLIFTGSSATGRRVAEQLGRRLVSSTLELSGCDALFVLDDANMDLAVRAAWFGATVNRGQTCLASRRVFVQRPLYQAFAEALRPIVSDAMPMRLALESQVKLADDLVRDALAGGARLLQTPRPAHGNGDPTLYAPTIVLDARPEMALCQQASFAPLLAVLPFGTMEEALRMEAQCPYALGASMFTRPARGLQWAGHLRAGSVAFNDVVLPTVHPATPFGGRGESGWGVTQGAEGLLELTVPQVVSVRGGKMRPHYDAALGKPPLSADGFRGLLEWSHSATLGQRFAGLRRLVRAARNSSGKG
jgi:acyl-CoA reductase-like NAD-dependent aldehyde dehydrogenase